jgi:glycosyl transferase family 11
MKRLREPHLMISFNALGRQGRFGNQMFQYAALLGIATRKGYEFCIPPALSRDEWASHQLLEAFDLPSLKCLGWQRTERHVAESSFAYDAELANHCPDGANLRGYFQSEKYFKDIEALVRREYTFKEFFLESARQIVEKLPRPIISLHVRRTDYLRGDTYASCSEAYYGEALGLLPDDGAVILFSDDIEWCQSQPLFQGPRWIYSDSRSNFLDMCLMSHCDHHIIANSSFSWWGAWLSGNSGKTVIAPRSWFGPGNAHLDAGDIVPSGWVTL